MKKEEEKFPIEHYKNTDESGFALFDLNGFSC